MTPSVTLPSSYPSGCYCPKPPSRPPARPQPRKGGEDPLRRQVAQGPSLGPTGEASPPVSLALSKSCQGQWQAEPPKPVLGIADAGHPAPKTAQLGGAQMLLRGRESPRLGLGEAAFRSHLPAAPAKPADREALFGGPERRPRACRVCAHTSLPDPARPRANWPPDNV